MIPISASTTRIRASKLRVIEVVSTHGHIEAIVSASDFNILQEKRKYFEMVWEKTVFQSSLSLRYFHFHQLNRYPYTVPHHLLAKSPTGKNMAYSR